MITFTNLKTGEVKTAFSFRIDGEKTYITFTEGGKEYGYFSDNVKIHDEDFHFSYPSDYIYLSCINNLGQSAFFCLFSCNLTCLMYPIIPPHSII